MQGAYTTMKGKMTCVAAPRKTSSMFAWSITEGLTTVGWGAPRKMAASRRGAVAAALEGDAGKMPTAPDPYFFGKQVLLSSHHLLHSLHLTSTIYDCQPFAAPPFSVGKCRYYLCNIMPAITIGFAILMRGASLSFTKADEEQPLCAGVHTPQQVLTRRCIIALHALTGGGDGTAGTHS